LVPHGPASQQEGTRVRPGVQGLVNLFDVQIDLKGQPPCIWLRQGGFKKGSIPLGHSVFRLILFFFMECQICVEKFNSRRKPVECPHCQLQQCSSCLKRYSLEHLVIETRNSECCRCKGTLTFDFLVQHFSKNFLLGEWREKRKQLLLELEMAQMPHTQHVAARLQELKQNLTVASQARDDAKRVEQELETEFKNAKEERALLRHELESTPKKHPQFQEIKEHLQRHMDYLASLKREMEQHEETLRVVTEQQHNAEFQVWALELNLSERRHPLNEHQEEKKERRTFTMPCPKDGCPGYLSNHYICGLCHHRICPSCHDPLLASGHQCDPGKVETIKLIRREGKPCPTCATIICKIDGCDQMWCIQCKTAFSWRTGKIETGRIHNPEYFRWMREHGREAPRLDQPICRDPVRLDIVLRSWSSVSSTYPNLDEEHLNDAKFVYAVALRVNNTMHNIEVDNGNHIDLRVRFLLGVISKEQMARTVCTRDRVRFKQEFARDLRALLFTVTHDVTTRVIQAVDNSQYLVILKEAAAELREFILYHRDTVAKFSSDHQFKFSWHYNKLYDLL
jgi:hypothetical protein